MSLQEIKDYLLHLDYPKEKCKNMEECYNIIKNGDGVKLNCDFPYTYVTNITNHTRHLGLYILDREKMNNSHNVGLQFNYLVKSKSRRYDNISSYNYWNQNKESVIKLGLQHLEKYIDQYPSEELPIELGGTKSINSNHIGLENECCLCLFRLGNPSSFPSNLMTKMITDYYNAYNRKSMNNKEIKILDISAGWGDRLLSACSLDATYLSCDPNTEMRHVYDEIINTYGTIGRQRVYTMPFEDYICDNSFKYNCLYTSPPFFDLEIYSDEKTQSTSRYKSLDSWLNNFLFPCLKKCDSMLESNSPIYLHLSDIRSETRSYNYVSDVINYVVKQLKWRFIGVYGHVLQDKEDKESETAEIRAGKNTLLLKPTKYIKKFKDGIRINKKEEALSQSIWYFNKE